MKNAISQKNGNPSARLNEKFKAYFNEKSELGKKVSNLISRRKEDIERDLNGEISQDIFQINEFYLKWKHSLQNIYLEDEISPELLIKHTLLISAVFTFLYRVIWLVEIQDQDLQKEGSILQNDIVGQILQYLDADKYFQELIKISFIHSTILTFLQEIQISSQECFENEDLFSDLYQNLIANTTRHPKGEFYTHNQLAACMVHDSYIFGKKVLDPACGSGIFLVEIGKLIYYTKKTNTEKLHALNQLFGIDINPIACFMARANLFMQKFQITKKISDFDPITSIIYNNALFLDNKNKLNFSNFFDIVIGNPPWVVLNRIPFNKEKEKIKQLGNQYNILRGGRYSTSTEITTIFIYHSLNNFLASNGIIFFVTPASLATGAQHEYFRQFSGMRDIEFWAFDNDVFRIHNLCFKAIKGKQSRENRLKIQWRNFHAEENPIRIKETTSEIYTPFYIKSHSKSLQNSLLSEDIIRCNKSDLVGRLVPLMNQGNNLKRGKLDYDLNYKENDEQIPYTTSYYTKEFRQGASLVPRNLIFIEIEQKLDSNGSLLSKIIPARNIQSKKYSTWEFKAYEHAIVESKHIYNVAKSTGLIPFVYYTKELGFLPIVQSEQGNLEFCQDISSPSIIHFQELEKLYLKNQKSAAQIKTLKQRLNYGNALLDKKQQLIPKVVYAGIGSIVKAAILRDQAIIDTSLYYYIPISLDEAYYLVGFLNSPFITEKVKKIGSTGANGSLRNIHKHPLNFGLPHFNLGDNNHMLLVEQAKFLEIFVLQFVESTLIDEPNLKEKPKSIQLRLFKDKEYLTLIEGLNQVVKKILVRFSSLNK